MSIHLSDDQLIDRLYGIAPADTHLDSCPECQVRWAQIQTRREQSALGTPSADFFRQQRRGIQSRIFAPAPSFRGMWVPATVAAVLMAGLLITRTAPQPSAKLQGVDPEIIETGWFEDTYSATRIMEPRAASPIRELFAAGTGDGTVRE